MGLSRDPRLLTTGDVLNRKDFVVVGASIAPMLLGVAHFPNDISARRDQQNQQQQKQTVTNTYLRVAITIVDPLF